jgi:hypothetical protein
MLTAVCSSLLLGLLCVACAPQPEAVAAVDALHARQQSGRMVEGQAVVAKLLDDDTKGARHQRFIVALDSELSLLVAHNIDIAPRVEGLAVGDTVKFYGQYEFNRKGGVIHWTHRAPRGDHAEGWLEHAGVRYQ